jgi:hypothetical protein
MAQETHLRASYWSVAAILDGIAPGLAPRALESLRYFLAGAVAVLGALRVRTLDGVIVVGTVAFLLAQFAGYFGSYVYIAAVAPVLCWRVDDWLRMGLPELVRAYGAMPELARRGRRPAPAPARAAPTSQPSPLGQPQVHAPGRLAHGAGAVHGAHGLPVTRGRAGRPSRSPG